MTQSHSCASAPHCARSSEPSPRESHWASLRWFKKIGIKDIIIIHKDQRLASGLANPAKPRRRKAKLLLTDDSRRRMPGKIDPSRNRFVTPTSHHDQFPSVARERLVFQRVEAPAKVIRPRVRTANDCREGRRSPGPVPDQRLGLHEWLLVSVPRETDLVLLGGYATRWRSEAQTFAVSNNRRTLLVTTIQPNRAASVTPLAIPAACVSTSTG